MLIEKLQDLHGDIPISSVVTSNKASRLQAEVAQRQVEAVKTVHLAALLAEGAAAQDEELAHWEIRLPCSDHQSRQVVAHAAHARVDIRAGVKQRLDCTFMAVLHGQMQRCCALKGRAHRSARVLAEPAVEEGPMLPLGTCSLQKQETAACSAAFCRLMQRCPVLVILVEAWQWRRTEAKEQRHNADMASTAGCLERGLALRSHAQ